MPTGASPRHGEPVALERLGSGPQKGLSCCCMTPASKKTCHKSQVKLNTILQHLDSYEPSLTPDVATQEEFFFLEALSIDVFLRPLLLAKALQSP